MKSFKSNKGLSLTELIIVLLITGIILISASNVMSECFIAEASFDKDIRSKQTKAGLVNIIASKIREASVAYDYTYTVNIPIGNSSVNIYPESESVVILAPKFDSSGGPIQPSSNTTTFTGTAFSLMPNTVIDSGTDKPDEYSLVQTIAEFDLNVKISDPIEIDDNLPIDWTSGDSYVVADNFKPAVTKNLSTTAFLLERDLVSFAFVPVDGYVYFPSANGSEEIDDSRNLTSCKLRNYRGY